MFQQIMVAAQTNSPLPLDQTSKAVLAIPLNMDAVQMESQLQEDRVRRDVLARIESMAAALIGGLQLQ